MKGFTLIELLIVIMIVALLSTLAVGGYTSYRRGALVDLAADELESQVRELRSRAIFGDFGQNDFERIMAELNGEVLEEGDAQEAVPRCYGVLFAKGAEDALVAQSFSQEFVGKRVWLGERWVYEGCNSNYGEFAPEDLQNLNIDDAIYLEQLQIMREGNETDLSQAVLRFSPPEGEVEASFDKSDFSPIVDRDDQLILDLVYGLTEDEGAKEQLILDLWSY